MSRAIDQCKIDPGIYGGSEIMQDCFKNDELLINHFLNYHVIKSQHMDQLNNLRYPIGRFSPPQPVSTDVISQCIQTISSFPKKLRAVTAGMSEAQLNIPYREDGWTIKEVVHHCADSHMNALIRFKLGLSEDNPTIKPYLQDEWVKQPDVKKESINVSLHLLEALHIRWASLLNEMSDDDYARTFYHPEMKKPITLAKNLCLYAWHCDHHLGHVTGLKERMDW